MITLTKTTPALTRRPASVPRTFLSKLGFLVQLRRSRRALAQLSPDQLADIGITRTEAEKEAARPLWDAPQHWYK